MKNIKLLALFFCVTCLLFTQATQAQCPTSSLTLTTQAEVDAFATNYPGCNILTESLSIIGFDITNLNGLSGLTRLNGSLVLYNTSITSYTGLHNITHMEGAFIFNNDSVIDNNGFEGLTSAKQISFSAAPAITDLTIFSNLETVTRKFGIGGSGLTSLEGLESLTTVGSGRLTDGFSARGPALTSLEGLNNLTRVNGKFDISYCPMLQDLSGLDNLNRIDAEFLISNNPVLTSLNGASSITFARELTIENNDTLPNLNGLTNLNMVELTITNNPGLINLTGLNNSLTPVRILVQNNSLTTLDGLQGLSSVDFFDILDNPNLTSLIGLENLATVDFFVIRNNHSLTNLTGMTGLTEVVEEFTIQDNNALLTLSGLDNLESVGNGIVGFDPFFKIINNNALEHVTGLGNFIFVDGRFRITDNPALLDMSGLENFSFARRFSIGNNSSLTNVDGLSNFSITENSFNIYGNPVLSSLSGLSGYDYVPSESVNINNNPLLSFCSVDGFCHLVENYTDKLYASNNAIGCATEAEIESICMLALPVEGMELRASLDADNHVLLNWETRSESNNSHFTILHSLDGRNWTNGETVPGAGNSLVLQTYKVVDTNPRNGINYYKIQQTDFDGEYSFSNIVSVDLPFDHPMVYPNPANGKLQIQMEDGNTLIHFKLVNLVGQTVYDVVFPPSLSLRQKEVSVVDLAPGYYYLTINNQTIPSPLIINR